MSDQDLKKPGVPSWQLKAKDEGKEDEGNEEAESPAPQDIPASRESIIDKARRFLQEDEVKNSTTEKKIAFLEEKGLNNEEIANLLGAVTNREASTQPTQSAQEATPPQQATTSMITSNAAPPGQTRDAPPIITYPEFLTTPTQPAPLITAQRLMQTLYIFGGISALLFGTTKYLVAPMVESLTSSRLELAETAQTNLDKLIERLEGMVTMKEDESDGDPTELFHRDIGIQTSPPESRSTSPTPDQASQLATITTHFKELEEEDDLELSTTINVLKEYLDSLAYVAPVYNYSYNAPKDENDEISRLKTEIRALKGAMLSTRSFPKSR